MTSLLVTNENYVMTYCKKFFTENKSFIYLMDWCHTFLHTSWIHQIQSFKCLFVFSNYYVLFKSDGCNDPTVGSASSVTD